MARGGALWVPIWASVSVQGTQVPTELSLHLKIYDTGLSPRHMSDENPVLYPKTCKNFQKEDSHEHVGFELMLLLNSLVYG